MQKNRNPSFFVVSVILIMLLSVSVSRTADSLHGKYFPENSPLWPHFYPNDFLPWGIVLFFSLGWFLVSNLFKIKNEKYRAFMVVLFPLFGYVAFMILYAQLSAAPYQTGNFDSWEYLFSRLIAGWQLGWVIGCLLAFVACYHFEKIKEEVSL
jgi:hypothetical protein